MEEEIKSNKEINEIVKFNEYFWNKSLYEFKLSKDILGFDKIERIMKGDNLLVIHYEKQHKCLVVDNIGNIIIPLDTYSFIDGFTRGLAKVSIYDELYNVSKYGIIDIKGNIVFPIEYDDITRFYQESPNQPKINSIFMTKEEKTFTYDFDSKVYHEIVPFWETEEWLEEEREKEMEETEEAERSFNLYGCHDSEGNFDNEKLEDAILSGEYVPEDW